MVSAVLLHAAPTRYSDYSVALAVAVRVLAAALMAEPVVAAAAHNFAPGFVLLELQPAALVLEQRLAAQGQPAVEPAVLLVAVAVFAA